MGTGIPQYGAIALRPARWPDKGLCTRVDAPLYDTQILRQPEADQRSVMGCQDGGYHPEQLEAIL